MYSLVQWVWLLAGWAEFQEVQWVWLETEWQQTVAAPHSAVSAQNVTLQCITAASNTTV